MVRGMSKVEKVFDSYVNCINWKQPWMVFPSTSTYRASQALDLIYVDLCGPLEHESLRKSKYFFTDSRRLFNTHVGVIS